MRALTFKIPITTNGSYLVQEDKLLHFYSILHTHPEVQITLILKSTGTLFAGDYIGQFKSGDVIVLGSDCPHVFKNDPIYYEKDSNAEAHAISIFLGTQFLSNQLFEFQEKENFSQFISKARVGLKANISELPGLRADLMNIKETKGFEQLIFLFRIILELSSSNAFKALSKNSMVSQANEADGKRLNDVFEFIFENYSRVTSLQEIASIANLTEQSFCRFFKKSTRKTFISFLNELRVDKATRLLRDKNVSILEISLLTGFNNLSHFNRQFLKIKKNDSFFFSK